MPDFYKNSILNSPYGYPGQHGKLEDGQPTGDVIHPHAPRPTAHCPFQRPNLPLSSPATSSHFSLSAFPLILAFGRNMSKGAAVSNTSSDMQPHHQPRKPGDPGRPEEVIIQSHRRHRGLD